MKPNLLVLGGTTEASALCRALSAARIAATISFAGRAARPAPQPVPRRIGGFGGIEGLADYLQAQKITHLVDATHPFAVRMSTNAVAAAAQTGVPLIALTRAPWSAQKGDNWTRVPDIAGAVAALGIRRRRIMLAIGRTHLAAFASNRQHYYLLRLLDPLQGPLPFADCEVVIDRGPFTCKGDLALMRAHNIDLLVCRNSGGTGAYAKLAAARALSLAVILIERPAPPTRFEAHSVKQVLDWLAHPGADLGV